MNARKNDASDMLDALAELSREYGGDPRYVLAGGGNTSVKDADTLYVKASGFALGTIEPDGFVAMDRAKLAAVLDADLPADRAEREAEFKRRVLDARRDPADRRRPSVEALLHHLLPQTFVVHTHPAAANAVACCVNGESIAAELFGDDVLWVECVDPGLILARTVAERVHAWRERTGRDAPEAILMQNHGLLTAGKTPDEIRRRTAGVMDKLTARVADAVGDEPFGPVSRLDEDAAARVVELVAPALRGLLSDPDGPLAVVAVRDDAAIMRLIGAAEGEAVTAAGPMTPDQIVYCDSYPMWFSPDADESAESCVGRLRAAVSDHAQTTQRPPRVVLVRGVGMFCAGRDAASADRTAAICADAVDVTAGATALGGAHPLPDDLRQFIETWEVEAYRRNIAAGEAATGRAAGKVALVTGAAQGFGLEIAGDLVANGAHVVLADINVDGARRAAERLAAAHGRLRAVAVEMNVTDARSVAAAVARTVREFGGLDLLVSNAGVLKAGSVKELAVEDFDFVTAVNYKGYFLCVQRAAPVFATQHLARPDCWSDVIQINSKSGLEGSDRNGAYAGSKFGGVGLTQSFAKELVADGVKVNSICPGNFFDGPLWSDPETGLFVQYLRTGKVPGAETIEDVRRFYERKVPMRRGCTTADVMKAVYYLMEQNYETGQAVPVTGGQVMLK